MGDLQGILRGISRDFRPLVRACVEQGWTATMCGSGHVRLMPPKGSTSKVVFMPMTTSDHRALANVRTKLKQQGVSL